MSSSINKTVEYNGVAYTLAQLSSMYGVPTSTINNRLRHGWGVEEAVKTPKKAKKIPPLPVEFQNGNIVEAIFRNPLANVFAAMQPRLMKPYVITAHSTIHANPCYTITLENGKDLIVYPNEFEICNVREVRAS